MFKFSPVLSGKNGQENTKAALFDKRNGLAKGVLHKKWRGQDLNLRPRGYEPRELPGCSTPQ